jgi:hypothetical protein
LPLESKISLAETAVILDIFDYIFIMFNLLFCRIYLPARGDPFLQVAPTKLISVL